MSGEKRYYHILIIPPFIISSISRVTSALCYLPYYIQVDISLPLQFLWLCRIRFSLYSIHYQRPVSFPLYIYNIFCVPNAASLNKLWNRSRQWWSIFLSSELSRHSVCINRHRGIITHETTVRSYETFCTAQCFSVFSLNMWISFQNTQVSNIKEIELTPSLSHCMIIITFQVVCF